MKLSYVCASRSWPTQGVPLSAVKSVRAHPVLLPQSATFLKQARYRADFCGRQRRRPPPSSPPQAHRIKGVLASELAADIHGLEVLASDIEDHGHNTTRFVIMGREA